MGHPFDTDREAAGLCAYLDASPSPFHACAAAAERLGANGFARLDETERWSRDPGRYYAVRGGSLVAWSTEYADGDATPFRVVGAHSDSPNLRIKPHPDVARAGWRLLGVEVYGGPLLNSWLDRDLGLSGRVVIRDAAGTAERLLVVDDPILRIAQLAVHLDREVNEAGVKLNPQQHLAPIWGVGTEPGDFAALLADTVGCERDDILGWDVMTHDLTPSRRIGQDRELIAAPRLDNLATCYAGVRALAAAVEAPPASPQVPVLVLFDHEENGSMSERGAFSTLLPAVLERIVQTRGGGREDYLRALGGTVIASGDMAHATHPNYADRHEPQHQIAVNAGPVLKINNRLRYATDARGTAAFTLACEQADVPVQKFVGRSDIPCGSTVGPMTAALTGATTVDFGAATLSMHSARELCGALDPAMYAGALAAFLAPA
ncbi:MAG: M18 family aminopeptidase [Actinomycetota bacterium]|nr:M18 family aminopeptidase [Actinomycetota bacterium]